MRSLFTLTLGAMLSACTPAASMRVQGTAASIDDEDRVLAFGCDDIAVIGKVRSGAYKPIEDAEDILGHGVIDATIKVRKIVRGFAVPRTLPIKYIAHVEMRSDREFLFVLYKGKDGYEMRSAQLMDVRPRLSERCA